VSLLGRDSPRAERGVKSAGVGGGLTGNAGDCGVIDDPHKGRQEAESWVIRERVWDWYSADFLSRLAPGAPLILIMTPWHEDDLSARVLKQDGRIEEGGAWKVVDLPAFAKPGDPLGRPVGAPLTHPKTRPRTSPPCAPSGKSGVRPPPRGTGRPCTCSNPKLVTEALVTEQMMRKRTRIPRPGQASPRGGGGGPVRRRPGQRRRGGRLAG
jgi:hypothetical protein